MTYLSKFNPLKPLVFAGLVAALVGFSATSAAGESGYYEGNDGYDYAIVTTVTPVYNDIQVVQPRTQCWDQTVAYQQPSPAGAVIGGLIGAAVGRNVGKGHNRYHRRYHHRTKGAKMIAGAAVGAVIGSAISRHQAPVQYGTQQQCQTVEEVTTRRELVGYDVRYNYNGQEFLTRTDRHPGDRIRVRVDVTPVW